MGLLQELPLSFVCGIQGWLSKGKVAGFSLCAPPQEGAGGLPWSHNFFSLLAHCLMTTWWHWQLDQHLAIFQGQGHYGSWWLVNLVPALCAQAYVQTLLTVLVPEPPASSEQRLSLKRPLPVTIASTWAFMLKTALWQENVCVPLEYEGRFMVLKFMNCGEWNVPSLSTGKKQRGCVFMTPKLWVISGGKNLVKPIIWHGIDLFPSHPK